jgi:protein-tyrosine-phosphatase
MGGVACQVREHGIRRGGFNEDVIIFVCTGNTCRSQVATAIANLLNDTPNLAGKTVLSAATNPRETGSSPARMMQKLTFRDKTSYLAHQFSQALLQWLSWWKTTADYRRYTVGIYTMTNAHMGQVFQILTDTGLAADCEQRRLTVQTLDPIGHDIADPYNYQGANQLAERTAYLEAYRNIKQRVEARAGACLPDIVGLEFMQQ